MLYQLKKVGKGLTLLTRLVMLMILMPVGLAKASNISEHWAKDTIEKMVERGIACGYPDGTFKPNNNITRAEFASLIVNAFNLEENRRNVFIDTVNHWAKNAIATAHYHGIINGYNDHLFRPDDKITREQMAIIVVNALKNNNLSGNAITYLFNDNDKISVWVKKSVDKAISLGLINGYPDNTFKPLANATRAEAMVVLYRSLSLLSPDYSNQTTYHKTGTYGSAQLAHIINDDVTINADNNIVRIATNSIDDLHIIISEKAPDQKVASKETKNKLHAHFIPVEYPAVVTAGNLINKRYKVDKKYFQIANIDLWV